MSNTLLKPLGEDLLVLLRELAPRQTLSYILLDTKDSFFMVRYAQKAVSDSYKAKDKNKERFHDFDVSVFTRTEPPSAVYVLTYAKRTHYFQTLVQLQQHLIRHRSIAGARDMDMIDDKRQPAFDAGNYAWRTYGSQS